MPFIPFVKEVTNDSLAAHLLSKEQYQFQVHPDLVDSARMVMANQLRELLMDAVLGKPKSADTKILVHSIIAMYLQTLIEDGGIQY